jgi:hypothetical protein
MGAPIGKTLNHLSEGGKAVDWLRVPWVTYSWCSCDVADESKSHMNRLLPDPCPERVAAPLV